MKSEFKKGKFFKTVGAPVEKEEAEGYLHSSGLFAIDRSWNVTHVPSGLRACHAYIFDTFRQAKAYVRLILPITDWSSVTNDNVARFKDAVLAAEEMTLQKRGIGGV